jgi:hypothetical protein
MFAVLIVTPGRHDIVELFGGEGKCLKLAVRRQLVSGVNFDVTCDMDLDKPQQIAQFWNYMLKHKPRVAIMGPPCTSFGPWSRFNKVHNHETWSKNHAIGVRLANLVAKVALFQLANKCHFIIENPWQSEIWNLPSFVSLIARPEVVYAQCDQCQVGLVDPAGVPTLKPTGLLASAETLIKRLRLICPRIHAHAVLEGSVNGISRCKFAQTWTHRLVELIIDGVVETLKHNSAPISAFPARPKAEKDRYGGSTTCKGCVAHAAKHDPRHTRERGFCRFPDDVALQWDCEACKRFLPSTNSLHTLNDSCQRSQARQRQRGYEREPTMLRDPKPPVQPIVAPVEDNEHLEAPPAVHGMMWKLVLILDTLERLDYIKMRDGWHTWQDSDVAHVSTNGRALRTTEPRFDAESFVCRSTFGYFPESSHARGEWWQLEDHHDMHSAENILTRTCALGFSVPILIMVFHKSAAIENNTRGENRVRRPPSSSSKNPFQNLTDIWDEEEGDVAAPHVDPAPPPPSAAEPEEGGGELELPPLVAEVEQNNLEDDEQVPIPD